jgi:peptide/nickel transport system permease protein
MRRRSARRRILFIAALLGAVYLATLAAPFVSPYDPVVHDRDYSFTPPTRLHWVDANGTFHLRPFVYAVSRRSGTFDEFEEDRLRTYPVRLFVRGARYSMAGVFTSDRHLFGVEAPARLYVLGTDVYGRDVFSRFLYGGRISLFAGLFGASVSLGLGLLLGTGAGFFGSWVDDAIMRVGELFLVLPWLYLLLAVRVVLPLDIGPGTTFLLFVAVIAVVGWARPARLVRGLVSSVRARDYVVAAQACGASTLHTLRRHVLPQLTGLMLTQAAILVPQFTVAEVTLSFFGLGVAEPIPSWGNLLSALQQYHVVVSYWWMFLPALALVPIFLLYYLLADTLHHQSALSQ